MAFGQNAASLQKMRAVSEAERGGRAMCVSTDY
jgi:hypothetical protein